MMMATVKQIEFATKLAEEIHGENAPEFLLAHREEGTFEDRKATSALIDALLMLKRAAPARGARAGGEEMPEPGYYCADYQGVLRFYRVAAGKGRHEGRVFLNRYRSDFQDRVGVEERKAALAQIALDPQAARELFARETTHCYACGRRLTDAESRRLGIGPECRKRGAVI